tara:strand:+ start:91 stop:795 length:705 start_codon:yes stop_codon:yes gene_type:complete
MSGFTQQLALLKSGDNNNVYPTISWTLQDYKDMMECVGKLEIIQNMGEDYDIPPEAFILNPDYGVERDEDKCEVCDTKTKTTIKTYGCMDMSVCKNCEEPDYEETEEDMKTIAWVSKNAKFIHLSAEAMARSNEPDTEPESDTEDEEEEEEEWEYHNYGTEKMSEFGEVSYQVGGGGLLNGNAYATVELKNGKYYYCEYGKNPSRSFVGEKIIWSDEIYDIPNPYECRNFNIID